MSMPVVRNSLRRIACVAELEAPDAIDLDRRHRKLGLDAPVLKLLEQGDAVQDQGSRQVDRVDPAAFA